MVSKDQIEKILVAIEDKGYALNCAPDGFSFFSHTNKSQYVKYLNDNHVEEPWEYDDEPKLFGSVELDEPWGNCVAIYIDEGKNRMLASEALDKYADDYILRNPKERREF